MKKGDFVIIQFGHNDVGKYDDPAAKDRPSLHCEGDETAEVTRLDGKKETVHTFGWYMRKYGNDAERKGRRDILLDGPAQGLGRRTHRPQRNAKHW